MTQRVTPGSSRTLIAIAISVVLFVALPVAPAWAACDGDSDTFGSGTGWKFSTQSVASSGTCNDVNIDDVADSDGSNGESRQYRGYYYDASIDEWIAGELGYKWVTEGASGLTVALTDVVTGTPYKYRSQQSGGWITSLD